MKFAQWVQSHHRSILFLLLVFALAGVWRGLSLPVGLFPQVSFPRIAVSLDAGDRPAERMAIEATWPVEEAVRTVPGVRSIRSTTSRGSADISINFEWGKDMVSAMLEVQSAIGRKLASLPAGMSFEVRRMDPTVFPVLGYSLTSDTHSLVELRNLALYQIRPALSTVPGVADVGVLGGATEEYQVIVNSAKLASFGLSLDDVAAAVSAANIITAVGRLEDQDKLYLIVSDTQLRDMQQIGQTVLRSGENGLVLLEDVAVVSRGTQPEWTRVTADGHDAVLFQVYQQPGGNTVQISRGIAAKLGELRGRLPSGIHVANWYDQSQLILASATSVRDAVMVGIVLAAMVLLMFLRNLRVTLIAAITVPVVLAATVLLLSVLGMSFNIMTLGGMAAAVGLIIDDAIVMVEHVMRRMRSGEGHYRSRVSTAAAEFTRPLAGSSASTIVIFAPLAFLSGVTGAFFKPLSLTMAAGLAVSFLVAWLAVPLLAVRLLRQSDAEQEEGGLFTRLAHRGYRGVMRPALRVPWLVLLVLLPLLGAGWYAYRHTGSGFMPAMDEGGFILDYHTPAGTSLTETDRLLRQVENILRHTPAVETYSRRTGLQLGGGVTEANQGDFFIRLKPFPRPGIASVMDNVRGRIEHDVPGVQIEMALLMEDLIGDLTAVPQPIEIKIYSDNEPLLRSLAPKVAAAIEQVPGVVDVNDGIVLAGDALEVRVNREKAALEGVAPDAVTQMLQRYLTGAVTTQVQRGPQMIDLRVWIPHRRRATIRDVEALHLRAPDGHLFPLTRVATVTTVTGQPEINRDNLKRMVAVTGRISGRDLGSTVRSVKAVLDRRGFLPKDIYYELGGLYQQQQIAFRGLITVFVAATVLVFVLLLFLYESFRVAAAMLVTTLLAVATVFLGLWITGTELNITAMMGMTMVIGIATEVAIFYYSEYYDLPADTERRERFLLAGIHRMRPIAMTTLAAILALLPLALGIGQGAAMQQPLAIAIISGLVVQLPLVLIVLPSLLLILGHHRPETGSAPGDG
jgi:CzcA family heavy metal efflux pump